MAKHCFWGKGGVMTSTTPLLDPRPIVVKKIVSPTVLIGLQTDSVLRSTFSAYTRNVHWKLIRVRIPREYQ